MLNTLSEEWRGADCYLPAMQTILNAAPQLVALAEQTTQYREALPDPSKLWALADYFDAKFPDDAAPEVQADLRRWARGIFALGLHKGIMAKDVIEETSKG